MVLSWRESELTGPIRVQPGSSARTRRQMRLIQQSWLHVSRLTHQSSQSRWPIDTLTHSGLPITKHKISIIIAGEHSGTAHTTTPSSCTWPPRSPHFQMDHYIELEGHSCRYHLPGPCCSSPSSPGRSRPSQRMGWLFQNHFGRIGS